VTPPPPPPSTIESELRSETRALASRFDRQVAALVAERKLTGRLRKALEGQHRGLLDLRRRVADLEFRATEPPAAAESEAEESVGAPESVEAPVVSAGPPEPLAVAPPPPPARPRRSSFAPTGAALLGLLGELVAVVDEVEPGELDLDEIHQEAYRALGVEVDPTS